jgi:ATP adenylyltransferase/5',5'''-P-1,P-4-tetraphosphate phosphorylase II
MSTASDYNASIVQCPMESHFSSIRGTQACTGETIITSPLLPFRHASAALLDAQTHTASEWARHAEMTLDMLVRSAFEGVLTTDTSDSNITDRVSYNVVFSAVSRRSGMLSLCIKIVFWIPTQGWIMVVPRRFEKVQLFDTGSNNVGSSATRITTPADTSATLTTDSPDGVWVGVNSLGFAGALLAKSEHEAALIRRAGILRLLQLVSIPCL